jgi:hypothetical protein
MDAAPFLAAIGRRLEAAGLEAILIGNAAAALHGAPVTTIDFDFLFRKTPRNLQKLKAFARALDATILRPYYPVSDLFRVVRDDGLQVDFMGTMHGVRSFEGLRERSSLATVGDAVLCVAALSDIVKSKKAAGRPRDRAVLDVLERTLEAQEASKPAAAPRRAQARKRS